MLRKWLHFRDEHRFCKLQDKVHDLTRADLAFYLQAVSIFLKYLKISKCQY